MTNLAIWQQHSNASSDSYTLHYFDSVRQKLELIEGESPIHVFFRGSLTFTRSASGMRTTCFLKVFGHRVVKAYVDGGGYDTRTHALIKAINQLAEETKDEYGYNNSLAFIKLMQSVVNQGEDFKDSLRNAGILAAHIGG